MKYLELFVVNGKKHLLCKLKISLYDLKKPPRMWHPKFDAYILSLVFLKRKVDHYIYSKEEGQHFIYVALYVGDMLLMEKNMDGIKEVKTKLSSKFNIKDIDETNFIMGMDIKRDPTTRNI